MLDLPGPRLHRHAGRRTACRCPAWRGWSAGFSTRIGFVPATRRRPFGRRGDPRRHGAGRADPAAGDHRASTARCGRSAARRCSRRSPSCSSSTRWCRGSSPGAPTDRGATRRLLEGTGSRLDDAGVELYERLFRRSGHVAATLGMMANWDLDSLRAAARPSRPAAGPRDRPPTTRPSRRAMRPAGVARCQGAAPFRSTMAATSSTRKHPDEIAALILKVAADEGVISRNPPERVVKSKSSEILSTNVDKTRPSDIHQRPLFERAACGRHRQRLRRAGCRHPARRARLPGHRAGTPRLSRAAGPACCSRTASPSIAGRPSSPRRFLFDELWELCGKRRADDVDLRADDALLPHPLRRRRRDRLLGRSGGDARAR